MFLVKWRFSSVFNNFKSWSPLSPRYFYPYCLKAIVSRVLYIIHIQAFKLLIMAFPILLRKHYSLYHANSSFILMSSPCSLFLSEVLIPVTRDKNQDVLYRHEE